MAGYIPRQFTRAREQSPIQVVTGPSVD